MSLSPLIHCTHTHTHPHSLPLTFSHTPSPPPFTPPYPIIISPPPFTHTPLSNHHLPSSLHTHPPIQSSSSLPSSLHTHPIQSSSLPSSLHTPPLPPPSTEASSSTTVRESPWVSLPPFSSFSTCLANLCRRWVGPGHVTYTSLSTHTHTDHFTYTNLQRNPSKKTPLYYRHLANPGPSQLYIPYSRKLSREKSFANFTVLWLFAKFFSVEFGGVASFGRAQVSNLRKFFP